MKKYSYNEKNGLWYKLIGDYYIPCLNLPVEEAQHIGIWGQRHLQYIRNNKQSLYVTLIVTNKLNNYLADIDKWAEDIFFRLEKELAEKEGITEELKMSDQMTWVKLMNNIHRKVNEIVNNEIIYN